MPATKRKSEGRQARPVRHLDYVDGFRCIAALSVMFGHLAIICFGVNSKEPFWILAQYLVFWINPVATFIVISGFCLMLPVTCGNQTLPGGPLHFLKKRAKRILPPYYITLALFGVLDVTVLNHKTGYGWDSAIPITQRGILTHLLLIQQLSGKAIYQFDPPMWSIGVEWWIYFLFPTLVIAFLRFGPAATIAVTSFGAFMVWWVIKDSHWSGLSPLLYPLFVLGMAGATIAFSKEGKLERFRQGWLFGILPLILVVPAWLAVNCVTNPNLRTVLSTMSTGIWAMTVLIQASSPRALLHKWLGNPFLNKIGKFSYTLYLVHYPLGQFFYYYFIRKAHMSQNLQGLAMFVIVGPLLVFIAYLLFNILENPFLNTKVSV